MHQTIASIDREKPMKVTKLMLAIAMASFVTGVSAGPVVTGNDNATIRVESNNNGSGASQAASSIGQGNDQTNINRLLRTSVK